MPTTSVFATRHAARRVLYALLFSLLAGCGGGGGGSSTPQGPTASVSISASPSTITLGQSTTLTWSASNASSCSASGAWTGAQVDSGSATVTPSTSGTQTYTLTCTTSAGAYGGGGTNVSGVASVTVNGPSAFSPTSLDADTSAVGALNVDTSLVNPWGIAFGPTTFAWVANNHSQTSTLYDGNGRAQPFGAALSVSFAPSAGGTAFDPTGIVYNASTDFVVAGGGASAPARFLFVGEGGMLAGWSPTVDATHAITVYTDAGGAVYKGLAIAQDAGASFLYATDFHNNKVDVFDASFALQAPSASRFTFQDPTLPAGYAPFGIQALPTGTAGAIEIFVSYAQQATPANHDNVNGAGLGLVDVYDTHGTLLRHLLGTGGLLNAPWGFALAPADFGTLSHALLVGNFGDGKIQGYQPSNGTFVGTLQTPAGSAFAVPGLWGIAFGNDAQNQPHNTLFYAAGTNNEANGEYGRIDLGATPPVLNQPPVVAITAPTTSANGTVTVTATATSSIAIRRVEIFAGGTSLGVVTTPPYSVQWDTTTVANGSIALSATATDADSNVGSSPAVSVLVNNGAPPATLTQLQSSIFTPICSGCHNGVGSVLPGAQDLTAGHTFTSVVNVTSLEVPTLKRVKPNDAAASYLIQKLEGTQASGARMPFGGPYLDQATIDQIKSWILNGAPND